MCGIFGYVGNKNSSEVIIDGLKRLEYRGYDSWGIAVLNSKMISVAKEVGSIGDYAKSINLPPSNIGIGHTRWATHGGVVRKNAHPHVDCHGKISVVHNGIVENFESLKKSLLKNGHKFISATDTEVIVHLIEEELKGKKFTEKLLFTAFLATVKKLKGLNAVVMSCAESPVVYAFKNGSPLVVASSNGDTFVSSDVSGIVDYSRDVYFLEDGETVKLSDKLSFYLSSGRKIVKRPKKIDWEVEIQGKGKFKHFMLKEIFDQPKVIRSYLQKMDEIKKLSEIIKGAKGTFFIGAGTAFNAGLGGVYFFSKIANYHVNTAFASEFNYTENFLKKKSLIIALSQSGETIDVIEPLIRAKKKSAYITGITNSIGSTIYRMADFNILLDAGVEKAVASTKAYTAKLSALLVTALMFANKEKEASNFLKKTSDEIERILKKENLLTLKLSPIWSLFGA